MNIIWSPQALEDLKHLHAYIADESPQAAHALVTHIVDKVARHLADMPLSGRVGRVANTRELVIADTPYIIPYRANGGRTTGGG